jgi:antitoxin (DNA-binding transcriptional repressor) of toxin-antitoxin stability system
MLATTFTELRNEAKRFFDLVEAGETVRVLRNGRPIADIRPIPNEVPSWKRRKAEPLVIIGAEIARVIQEERQEERQQERDEERDEERGG